MYLTYNKSRASGWLIQLTHILKIQIHFIFSVYMLGCSPVRILHGCKVATTVPGFAYFHSTCSAVYFSILSVGGKKSLLVTHLTVDFSLCLLARFASHSHA